MKALSLLGIYREQVFSPGKIEDDAAIMEATLEELSRKGWEVRGLRAESLTGSVSRPEHVLSMAQSNRVLTILGEWSTLGTRVINTVPSVRNCYRKPLTQILSEAGVCIPPSRMLTLHEAKEAISFSSSDRLWLKRGDVHAIEAGDVASVTCREEFDDALQHFHKRDIRDILVQDHAQGRVVKFYGVGSGEYFKAYLASSGEELASSLLDPLQAISRKAARAVGLEVYGGDAVLTEANGAVLIDLNDWPSFSRCRRSASVSIAAYAGTEFQADADRISSPPRRARAS